MKLVKRMKKGSPRKSERLIALMPDIDEKISAKCKGLKIELNCKSGISTLRLAVYEALYEKVYRSA